MKEINIWEILKNVPEGTKLWSNLLGTVTIRIEKNIHPDDKLIRVRMYNQMKYAFYQDGRAYENTDSECVLWPSKEIRDWSRWEEELQWREIEQWIVDGVCEVKAKFHIHEGYIPFEISKHSDYTSKMRIHANIHHFRKKEINPYQHLIDAIAEGKQIEGNFADEGKQPEWELVCIENLDIFFVSPNKIEISIERYRIYDPYREFKEAYERGEIIQIWAFEKWYDLIKDVNFNGDWTAEIEYYRIKPKEPMYIPFTFEDRDIFRGKWVRDNNGNKMEEAMITYIDNDGIRIFSAFYYFNAAIKHFTFLDGTPFGKLAE